MQCTCNEVFIDDVTNLDPMPTYKPSHAKMPEATANSVNASSAPGACSIWGGPNGKAPIQPKYIPPKQAKRR